jgi:drug/metabolite transporter (DMT)-like permease
MTPGQPRPVSRDTMSLSTVQRWVLSVLAATTIMHLSGGLVVAAAFLDTTARQVGLLVIATAFGLLAVVAALLIHHKHPLSPWLVVGLLPTVVGVYFIFLR